MVRMTTSRALGGGPSTVGADDLPDHEPGFVGSEIKGGGGNVAGLTEASDRSVVDDPLARLGGHLRGHRGFDKAGSDGVDDDAVLRDFEGDRFGEANDG